MTRGKWLSRRQLAFIDDLSKGEIEEQQVLDKHKVGRRLYTRWLADPEFCEQLNQRVDGAYRRSVFVIARCAGPAAAKLGELVESENPETARKACLDIVTMNPSTGLKGTSDVPDTKTEEQPPISAETASRLLEVLAEEKDASQKSDS